VQLQQGLLEAVASHPPSCAACRGFTVPSVTVPRCCLCRPLLLQQDAAPLLV
jgi:hypothetical protein